MTWKQYRTTNPLKLYASWYGDVNRFEHRAYKAGKTAGRKEAVLVVLLFIWWWI